LAPIRPSTVPYCSLATIVTIAAFLQEQSTVIRMKPNYSSAKVATTKHSAVSVAHLLVKDQS
jgi:hypothetical protein